MICFVQYAVKLQSIIKSSTRLPCIIAVVVVSSVSRTLDIGIFFIPIAIVRITAKSNSKYMFIFILLGAIIITCEVLVGVGVSTQS